MVSVLRKAHCFFEKGNSALYAQKMKQNTPQNPEVATGTQVGDTKNTFLNMLVGRALEEARTAGVVGKLEFSFPASEFLPLFKEAAERTGVTVFQDNQVVPNMVGVETPYFNLREEGGFLGVTISVHTSPIAGRREVEVGTHFAQYHCYQKADGFQKEVILLLRERGHLPSISEFKFSEELAAMPVPFWVELGYSQNEPWDGYAGYPRLALKSEVSELVQKWAASVK